MKTLKNLLLIGLGSLVIGGCGNKEYSKENTSFDDSLSPEKQLELAKFTRRYDSLNAIPDYWIKRDSLKRMIYPLGEKEMIKEIMRDIKYGED
ncbi:MAG: hypothetical protein Q8Q86_02440 [Candidatus Daviesbacteria bacterium]|nr:hypothetical protein [Candidatus Daviesbacteria bacterium]